MSTSITQGAVYTCPHCLRVGIPSGKGDYCTACSTHFTLINLVNSSCAIGIPLKLNLGCCDQRIGGYLGVDICPGAAVDVIADLSEPWPWDSGTVDEILAFDVIEHLPDKILTMNEAHRVLKVGGVIMIHVPTTDGSGAFQDPTHVSYWNRRSFMYHEAGNPYCERFIGKYRDFQGNPMVARFKVWKEQLDRTVDGPKLTIALIKV
jgi:predicted SAM-dependent methyltransferase